MLIIQNQIQLFKKDLKIKQIDITFLAKWIVLVLVQRKTRPPKRLILTGPNNKNREMIHLQQFYNKS